MKPRHSDSLVLVWRVAELEARHLNAFVLEPMHLLIGLCKVVDLDLPHLVSKDAPDRDEVLEELLREVRKLRTIFQVARVNAKAVRRSLRRAFPGSRDPTAKTRRLRRGSAAKDIFADAEHFAHASNGPVYPVHLLYATLLAEDKDRDVTFRELGIGKGRLLDVTRRDVLPLQLGVVSESKSARVRWN